MIAVQIARLDGPAGIDVGEVADPVRAEDEVLVRVHAAGLIFPDLLQAQGGYQVKPALPFIPGVELAGVVVEAPATSAFRPGDRVIGAPGRNAFAERIAIRDDRLYSLPDAMTFEQGAGLPSNLLTVHFALVQRGRLEAGQTVLVHGAAGGIGVASVQLAKALGATVYAVTSSPEKAEVARSAGADVVLPVDGFLPAVKELTGGRGVDLVVDPVGGDRFTDSLRSLASEGTLLVIGFTGGEIPTVKVNRLLLNNTAVVGVGWGAYFAQHPQARAERWARVLPLVESGRVTPHIGAVYPATAAREAFAALESRTAVGKIVLTFA